MTTAVTSALAGTAASEDSPSPGRAPSGRRRRSTLTRASGLGLGVAMLWFSLLVLIPLVAVVVQATRGGWSAYAAALTSPQTVAALQLTVGHAVLVTAIDIVTGTAIAWVLVRDSFVGKRVLEVVIDIPFALPTIVAGLVLLSLYGANSPLGLQWANTSHAVTLAFLFVTLPFVVRTVQPVLMEIEPEVEEAAASLGASRFTVFRMVILPSLVPAITSGAALAFARAISEYGSLVLLSGNLPYSTEVASVRILSFIEGDQLTAAAAVASLLLVVALVVIVGLEIVSRRVARHG
ncbi:sulfate ABC transporter permease subunit CysT [Microlunatus spumicola]|uniref:Sulfate transport system permease protein CysT n=1 Tax=Microlunatus spumicola TaxID=81499 RepID=A0ABP6Y6N9_9ACTN